MAVTLTLYLDRRATRDNDPAPLKICVNKRSRSAYLKTGISLRPSEWDAKSQRVINHPHRRQLNDQLQHFRLEAQEWMLPRIYSGEFADMNATQIKDALAEHIFGKDKNVPPVRAYALAKIATRNAGTRAVYETELGKWMRYDPDIEKKRIDTISVQYADKFEKWLRERYAENTANTALSFFRWVMNCAIAEGWVTVNPFAKRPTGYKAQHKRNLSADDMRRLLNCDPATDMERRALDAFRFSFLAHGINPKDISLLRVQHIFNGRIDTTRAKTGGPISVRITPELQDLIDRYCDGDYLLAWVGGARDYRHTMEDVNAALKGIAQRLGLPPVTMYWARHTLASLLVELGYSVTLVGAVLAHLDKNNITMAYVSVSDKQIDDAMRAVTDWVLYGTRNK